MSVSLISASARASAVAAALEFGDRIVGRIESVGVDLRRDRLRRRLGALVHRAVGDPERREFAAGVERLDARRAPLAAEDAVEFAGDQLAQLVDDRAVGGDGHGRGGRRARGLAGSAAGAAAFCLVNRPMACLAGPTSFTVSGGNRSCPASESRPRSFCSACCAKLQVGHGFPAPAPDRARSRPVDG